MAQFFAGLALVGFALAAFSYDVVARDDFRWWPSLIVFLLGAIVGALVLMIAASMQIVRFFS